MIALRDAVPGDLPALSALCLRSKAHWGYDAAFIEACRAELTLTEDDLSAMAFQVAQIHNYIAGVAAIKTAGAQAELELMFVDPPFIGQGVGAELWRWALYMARDQGARTLRIEAEPQAAGFYEKAGAVQSGDAPSLSVPGRSLPVYSLAL